MPSEAFFKLDEDKRKKIISAIKQEFEENSFDKASVNKIVENAGISKGSFWFYFENKEEAINYIIETYIEIEKEEAIKLLSENNGDIFECYTKLYDFIKENKFEEFKRDLLTNIFKDLIINDEKITSKFSGPNMPLLKALICDENFNNTINMQNFKNSSKEALISLIKILNYIMRSNIIDGIRGIISEEKAKENFLREIEFLKRGILKD